MKKAIQFLQEVRGEVFRVNWPTREEIIRLSGVVIAVSAAVAALLGTLDYAFGFVFRKIVLGI